MSEEIGLGLAVARGWTCIAHDESIIATCTARALPYLTGIDLLGEMARAGHLDPDKAKAAMAHLRTRNPGLSP